jgi:hypothetical protein
MIALIAIASRTEFAKKSATALKKKIVDLAAAIKNTKTQEGNSPGFYIANAVTVAMLGAVTLMYPFTVLPQDNSPVGHTVYDKSINAATESHMVLNRTFQEFNKDSSRVNGERLLKEMEKTASATYDIVAEVAYRNNGTLPTGFGKTFDKAEKTYASSIGQIKEALRSNQTEYQAKAEYIKSNWADKKIQMTAPYIALVEFAAQKRDFRTEIKVLAKYMAESAKPFSEAAKVTEGVGKLFKRKEEKSETASKEERGVYSGETDVKRLSENEKTLYFADLSDSSNLENEMYAELSHEIKPG